MKQQTPKIQAVRGMQDLLPAQKEIFRFVEDKVREVLAQYGYQEIGMPVIESTQLFKRLVGETTDIVEKEMYTFDDRNGDSLTLRPEGTAGCARFAQQNGLTYNQVQRLWYAGSMFRHERPQKGRYRQFEQIGVETFGMAGPDIDAELLLMTARLWQNLGIRDQARLELNSLGTIEARGQYRKALQSYFSTFEAELDEDSQRRLNTNPLRILDSKDARTRELLVGVPQLADYLDDESRQHFEGLLKLLDDNDVDYVVNPLMVRGLDYYNNTVFEWVTDTLGAQGAICAGGRYDGLVEQLGGKATPGVGFAMGIDRLALMLEPQFAAQAQADIYIAAMGDKAANVALQLAERIRTEHSEVNVLTNCGSGKFKSQLKRADNSGARLALIIGEDEVANKAVTIKHLRDDAEQASLQSEHLDQYLADYFKE